MKVHQHLQHLLLVVMALALTSCGLLEHQHQFDPDPTIGTLTEHRLKGKVIAFDLSETPEALHESANGHTFTITGIRHHADQVVRKLFGNEQIVEKAEEADVVLALDLDLELSAALMGTEATCVATWTIRDNEGAVLARSSKEEESAYPVMANGGNNCELAALLAMSGALDGAMAQL